MTQRSLGILAGVVLGAAALALPCPAPAAEPAAAFVKALRDKGYHDVALEYLDRMADSPLVTLEFKETILYEKGLTLVDASRYQRDAGIREKQLEEARVTFEQFLQTRVDHELTDACKNQLGNLLVERGRAKVARAERSADRVQLLKQARELYDEAYRVFATSQNDLKEKLAGMTGVFDPKREQDKIDLRESIRAEYLQAQLLSAAILEESADTVAIKESQEYTELLSKAAAEYAEIYEKYRTRVAGSYALMYQGRCNLKMGKYKDALSYFNDLLDQPDEPEAFRTLKIKSMNYAMECWMAEDKLAEAVSRGGSLVATVRPNESKEAPWLELRVKVARASRDYLKLLRETKPNEKAQIKTLTKEASDLAKFVANIKSEYQAEAGRLVAELGGVDPVEAVEQKQPETFAEARDAGKAALDQIQTAGLILKMVPPRLEREKDEKMRAELQLQIDQAEKQVVEAQSLARKFFAQALGMVDPNTPREDVNVVRYFLCYLLYKDKDYHQAALVGEFVARRFPSSAGARQCAKIAMASYIVMYTESTDEEKQFETDRIVAISNYILEKWPDQPEAEEAINTLIPFMIKSGDLEKALDYVRKIPEGSRRRGEAELKVGQALWSEYLSRMQERRQAEADAAPGSAPLPDDPQLESFRVQAEKVLSAGIGRMEKSGISDTLVTAVLSLAQIYVDSGQASKAVELIEHPTYGIVKLASDGHAATKREGVAEEIYKTALRAFIGSLAEGSDAATTMAKAKQMMTGLKSTVPSDAAGQKKLVGIYVGLARSLQQQIELADPQSKQALSEGFETFLKQVGEEATEFSVLNWVAETFRNSLGKANLGPGGKLTPQSTRYYTEAVKTYKRMLALADQNESFLPVPALKPHLSMQVALTQRDLLEFEDAMSALVGLLEANDMNVSVQIEAARTYQRWAAFPGKEDLYNYAIRGAKPKGNKNLVWGWGRLAKLTAGKEKFKDTFHQARLMLATCRYKLALAKTGKEKNDVLAKARNDIGLTYRLYPDLGGAAWRKQYDDLLRSIQTGLGEKVIGLKAMEPSSA